jgi:hypothetical protein
MGDFLMKIAMGVLVLALCGSLQAVAQVPLPGCGCGVSSSTIGCSCPAGINKETLKATNEPTVCDGRREIDGDLITVHPGGLLTRPLPDEDDLIIGKGDGTLVNEAKSQALPIDITAGVVLFLPKDEPYKLRNVGKQDLYIMVIRMRTKTPASQ